MSRLLAGAVSGGVFGALAAAAMLPMQFPDKTAALTGAFLNRMTIGFLIGAMIGAPQLVAVGVPPWAIGAAVGFLVSASDAIITKAYAPLIVIGSVGGAVIGWVVGRSG
ncbi:MAG TPA: hypothetical protein VN706_04450 [Gemmatimonadaceae bacterium]|nr:hypothetical protein [Gemmatimonadaceae bacterium]